jgi:hypothetical protein
VNAFMPRRFSCGIGATTAAMIAALGLAGCQEGIDPGSPDVAEPDEPADVASDVVKPTVGRANDLTAVMERTRFAFRAEGAVFRAQHPTMQTTVTGGVVDVVPFHAPEGDRVQGDTLRLETTGLVRGDLAMDTYVSDTKVDAEGRIQITRADVVEQIANTASGVEQSWLFFDSPDAVGDVEVTVNVSGHQFVAANDSGLHFASPGRLGFRYGHGTWIDANGHEVAVPARFEDGAIRLTVPHDVIDNSAYPAVLDPTITPEVAIDAPVQSVTGTQAINPDIATSGTGFLAVWRDDRNGIDSDIYGARIGADGSVLDALGLAIATDAGVQDHPDVAFVNGNYLVVWEDFRDPPVSGNLVAARVGSDGTITRIGNVAATSSAEILPSIAVRGNEALVVFRKDNDVRGAIYNGTTFGSNFNIATNAALETDPVAAADPAGNYLAVWTHNSPTGDIYARRVTAAGALTGNTIVVSAGTGAQDTPTVAWNGTQFVIVWANPGIAGSGRDLYGTRVTTTGTVLDTRTEGTTMGVGGILITNATRDQLTPSLACNGTSCLLLWRDRRNINSDIFGRVINNDFTFGAADLPIIQLNREQQVPAVIASGTGFAAIWQDQREGGPYYSRASRLGADGSVVDTNSILLNLGNNRENEPVAAVASNNNFLAAWADSRVAGHNIVGSRVGYNGVLLDATAKTIVNDPAHQSNAAIAFGSANFLVVWEDGRNPDDDIFAARVTPLNALVDAVSLPIATATADQSEPAVASNGASWLVTWQDRRTSANGWDVYGAIVNADGSIAVNDIQICARTADQYAVAATFDPASGNYFVVWTDVRAGANLNDIYGARVTPAGAVLDDCGVAISTRANGQLTPAVTQGGGRVVVAWDDRGNADADIYAARINLAGGSVQVLDPAGLAVGSFAGSKQTAPTVGFVDNSFLVTWVDERNLATTGTDLFGNQISLSGTLSAQFAVSTQAGDEDNPYIAAPIRSDNDSLLTYDRYDGALQTQRVYFRRIATTASSGTACSSNAQCETGFCVDGRCCNNECGNANLNDCQACSTARGAAVDGICGPIAAGRICRNYYQNQAFCDLRELCDGTITECPADVGRREGQACTTVANTPGVCTPNAAPGPHFCQ